MSTDEPDLTNGPVTDAGRPPPDPAADLRRVLHRIAWRDEPTIRLRYDDSADVLTATILRLPAARTRRAHGHLTVDLDGPDDQALPTEIRLAEFVGSQRSDAAGMARELLGPTAWRHAVLLTVDGAENADVDLDAAERDGLLEAWKKFARPVRVVGVQVLPGLLRAALVDEEGRRLQEWELLLTRTTPEAVADGVAELATSLWAKDGDRPCSRSVGVQIAGPVESGVVHRYDKFGMGCDGWKNVRLEQMVADRVGAPTVVLNDVSALAEWQRWFGIAQKFRRFGLVLVSEGIGGALVTGNVVDLHSPMELGNIVIHPDGAKCQCGNTGCVEATAAVWALVEKADHAARDHQRHMNYDLAGAVELAQAADEHLARDVQRVFRDGGKALAAGIGSVQALLNLDGWVVYLPPEMHDSTAGDSYWDGIDQFGHFVSFEPYRHCELGRRTSSRDEGPRGAALAAMERVGLSSPPQNC